MPALFAAATGILVLALLASEHARHRLRGWIKGAASAGFLATAVAAGAAETRYGRWVLVALALSWIGDVVLVSAARSWFLTGLVAFLSAHVGYLVGFGVLGLDRAPTLGAAAVLAVPAAAVARWLWGRVPSGMRTPILAYIVVISAMVAGAVGTAAAGAPGLVVPAAALFYVSDLLVARDRFVDPGLVNRMVGLPLYYAAQVLFALSTGLV